MIYIFNGATHSDASSEYLKSIGMNEEQIESVKCQEEFEDSVQKEKDAANKSAARLERMLTGAEYSGYQVSLTSEDGNGMIQVKNSFELGLISTVIHFECGTNMPINASEFTAFAEWFVAERNKFFT
jgi:hypothetical protein